MTQDEPLEKKYEKVFAQAAGGNPVFPYEAKLQMSQMVEAIARGRQNMDYRLSWQTSPSHKGGFLAEEFHAETFNLDAILKDKTARAVTDSYEPEWSALNRNGNDGVADIIITDGNQETLAFQSKYNANAETTAGKAAGLSQVKDGRPKYQDADGYLAPSDQVNPQRGEISVKEHAEAASQAEMARGGDPAQVEAYRQTARKTSDTISKDGASSTPLSKREAEQMGQGDLSKIEKIEKNYQTRSTLQQMKKSAANAAAMSAVMTGTVNIVRHFQLVREGKMTVEEATIKVVAETASAAADSAVKASANTGVQSLMVRYGSEKVVGALAQQGFRAMARTCVVTVGVTCAIDAVKDLILLGTERISKEEFFERQGKGMLTTSAGVAGGAVGAVAASSTAVALGFASAALAPLVGGIAGGLIAGLAMQAAIENRIEKPYRQILENTRILNESLALLEDLSKDVLNAQQAFSHFIRIDEQLDRAFEIQMKRTARASASMTSAIDKI